MGQPPPQPRRLAMQPGLGGGVQACDRIRAGVDEQRVVHHLHHIELGQPQRLRPAGRERRQPGGRAAILLGPATRGVADLAHGVHQLVVAQDADQLATGGLGLAGEAVEQVGDGELGVAAVEHVAELDDDPVAPGPGDAGVAGVAVDLVQVVPAGGDGAGQLQCLDRLVPVAVQVADGVDGPAGRLDPPGGRRGAPLFMPRPRPWAGVRRVAHRRRLGRRHNGRQQAQRDDSQLPCCPAARCPAERGRRINF